MDSLICITCSLENNENTFCSALRHKSYLTLPYVYHRIKIHSALELSRTALLGCPLTIERVSFRFTSKGKREFVPRDQVSPLLAVLCPLFSSFTQFFIHKIGLSCFYLFIFYFEKFSTWIWHLPFAVYVRLNLSNSNLKIPADKNLS